MFNPTGTLINDDMPAIPYTTLVTVVLTPNILFEMYMKGFDLLGFRCGYSDPSWGVASEPVYAYKALSYLYSNLKNLTVVDYQPGSYIPDTADNSWRSSGSRKTIISVISILGIVALMCISAAVFMVLKTNHQYIRTLFTGSPDYQPMIQLSDVS